MRAGLGTVLVLAGLMAVAPVTPSTAASTKASGGGVATHWTPARMKAAIPRDLRVDARGLAYLQQPDGTLVPHGHSTKQLYATSRAGKPAAGKPGGTGDATPPVISNLDPDGDVIGGSYTFKATVTDGTGSGVRSVTFTIVHPNGATQSFAANGSGGTYTLGISGFTDSTKWAWRVTAKDLAGKGGNTSTASAGFTVDTGSGGGGGGGGGTPGGDVANDPWTFGGAVQNAAGRIYFEMPANSRLTRWNGYVCSGTVATDEDTGRSVIITAAHCVFDDVYKVFARNVMFIPNQDGTSAAGTDTTCSNDPMGCWRPSFGVVDTQWTAHTFPDNIPWDYAFYVVANSGAHTQGLSPSGDVLDAAAGSLPVNVDMAPDTGQVAHALGYSYSEDPNFMYCSEPLGTEPPYNWWLGQCGLSGGSSGGPWVQPLTNGTGPIISVNSWGWTDRPGMAGPRLHDTSAGCVFTKAKGQDFDSATIDARGVATTCP